MYNPDKVVKVTIGNGRGGSRSRTTTQSEVAKVLINATVNFKNSGGANADFNSRTNTMNLYVPGIRQN